MATSEQQDLARWLLAHELGKQSNQHDVAGAAEAVCGKLHQPLARLLGTAGFHALLLRALDLSVSQFPFLKGVGSGQQGEGCLNGAEDAARGNDPQEVEEGFATLFAQLLWLLVTFIGEDLAMRQVARVWPEAPLGDLGSGAGEAKE